jgi:hypothetical protein
MYGPLIRNPFRKSNYDAGSMPATCTADDLFEMANLYPRTTGLPMTVWVRHRGNAGHGARVEVNATPGNRASPDNSAVIAVRPSPHVIAGRLSPDDERAAFNWITLNDRSLVAYWDGDIDTGQPCQALKPLPAL